MSSFLCVEAQSVSKVWPPLAVFSEEFKKWSTTNDVSGPLSENDQLEAHYNLARGETTTKTYGDLIGSTFGDTQYREGTRVLSTCDIIIYEVVRDGGDSYMTRTYKTPFSGRTTCAFLTRSKQRVCPLGFQHDFDSRCKESGNGFETRPAAKSIKNNRPAHPKRVYSAKSSNRKKSKSPLRDVDDCCGWNTNHLEGNAESFVVHINIPETSSQDSIDGMSAWSDDDNERLNSPDIYHPSSNLHPDRNFNPDGLLTVEEQDVTIETKTDKPKPRRKLSRLTKKCRPNDTARRQNPLKDPSNHYDERLPFDALEKRLKPNSKLPDIPRYTFLTMCFDSNAFHSTGPLTRNINRKELTTVDVDCDIALLGKTNRLYDKKSKVKDLDCDSVLLKTTDFTSRQESKAPGVDNDNLSPKKTNTYIENAPNRGVTTLDFMTGRKIDSVEIKQKVSCKTASINSDADDQHIQKKHISIVLPNETCAVRPPVSLPELSPVDCDRSKPNPKRRKLTNRSPRRPNSPFKSEESCRVSNTSIAAGTPSDKFRTLRSTESSERVPRIDLDQSKLDANSRSFIDLVPQSYVRKSKDYGDSQDWNFDRFDNQTRYKPLGQAVLIFDDLKVQPPRENCSFKPGCRGLSFKSPGRRVSGAVLATQSSKQDDTNSRRYQVDRRGKVEYIPSAYSIDGSNLCGLSSMELHGPGPRGGETTQDDLTDSQRQTLPAMDTSKHPVDGCNWRGTNNSKHSLTDSKDLQSAMFGRTTDPTDSQRRTVAAMDAYRRAGADGGGDPFLKYRHVVSRLRREAFNVWKDNRTKYGQTECSTRGTMGGDDRTLDRADMEVAARLLDLLSKTCSKRDQGYILRDKFEALQQTKFGQKDTKCIDKDTMLQLLSHRRSSPMRRTEHEMLCASCAALGDDLFQNSTK